MNQIVHIERYLPKLTPTTRELFSPSQGLFIGIRYGMLIGSPFFSEKKKTLERKGREKMVFNHSKVRGKIKEVFGTQAAFASALGISTATLSAKLNNEFQWKSSEIFKACELLEIDKEEIPLYFFTPKVE